jgi:hypothetical protein
VSTPFLEYSPGDVITSEDLNAVRDAINRLEEDAWASGVPPLAAPDGTRTVFTFPDPFEPGTCSLWISGLRLTRDEHYEEGPGANQITMLVDDPLLAGDALRADYLRSVIP